MEAAVGVEKNHLNVRCLKSRYLVSSDHPYPEKVRSSLDEAAAKSLPFVLSLILSRWSSAKDPSIWFIRRLDLDVDVNVAWDREKLAKSWASAIAGALAAQIEGNSDGENVVRFESRSALLASFLDDLADSSAWGKWYYEGFKGLRTLPVSAAVRTAICEDPTTGLEALLQLSPHGLRKVLFSLTEQDARWALDALSGQTSTADEQICFNTFLKILETGEAIPIHGGDEWKGVLLLCLMVWRERLDLKGPILKTAALAIVRLNYLLSSASESRRAEILRAVTERQLSVLYSMTGIADGEVISPLIRCPPDMVKRIIGAITSRLQAYSRAIPSVVPNVRYTPFGGIFLLLPLLNASPLSEAAKDWPDLKDCPPVNVIRLLVVMKCLGRSQAHMAFSDPLVRDLLGIDASLTISGLADWQRRISGSQIESYLQGICLWERKRCWETDQTEIVLNLRCSRGRVVLFVENTTGYWFYADIYNDKKPESFIKNLKRHLSSVDYLPGRIVCETPLLDPLRTLFPDITVPEVGLSSDTEGQISETPVQINHARLEKLQDDLSYLSLPDSFSISRRLDIALSLIAQNVMREFARRLPGFGTSSLMYLYNNFLDFGANVEEEPQRRVVCLKRPPLNLVLNMTGMTRGTYKLSWLDECPFVLFQGE
jgi:hypothetical protein